MSKIIISTESCSDLPWKITIPNNIEIVPMHVSFGKKMLYDGTFEPWEIDEYFKEHKALPTTSAVNPREYVNHFKSVFKKYPECNIIHISYSSSLSVSYQNAVIASEEFDCQKLKIIDSLNASAGTGVLVMLAVEIVKKYSDVISLDECVSLIKQKRSLVKCTFMPEKLDYMKAGGRISGLTHLGATVLGIKQSLFVSDGYIETGKKYRGDINRIAHMYFDDFIKSNNLKRDFVVIGYTYGVRKSLLFSLKRQAHKMGFAKSWCFRLGSAVTSHTGPVCVGFSGVLLRNDNK